jgi:hypothetical protein
MGFAAWRGRLDRWVAAATRRAASSLSCGETLADCMAGRSIRSRFSSVGTSHVPASISRRCSSGAGAAADGAADGARSQRHDLACALRLDSMNGLPRLGHGFALCSAGVGTVRADVVCGRRTVWRGVSDERGLQRSGSETRAWRCWRGRCRRWRS